MNDDFLVTMYRGDDDETPVKSDVAPDRGIMNMPALSSSIRKLEREIAELSKIVEEQRRIVKRQDTLIHQLMRAQHNNKNTIRDLERELDGKMNLRGEW